MNCMKKMLTTLAVLFLFVANGLNAQIAPEPVAQLPFEFENNRLRLTLEIDGQPLKMLLDSGASTSVLFASDETRNLPIDAIKKASVLFPALDEQLEGARLKPLQVQFDDLLLDLNKIVLLDDKTNLKQRLLLRYDGIIGQELFERFTIEVDPAKKIVRLFEQGTDLSQRYRTRYKLYIQNGAPHIRFRSKMPWEETPTKKEMLVDTGYPGAIVFWDSQHYRRAAKLTPESFNTDAAIVGRANFRFGKLIFNHAPVYLGAYPPRQIGERDGLIGATILNNFRYAFDFTGAQMWMLSHADDAGFRRSVDGTFYPPNDDEFVFSDFAERLSSVPKLVVQPR